MLEWLERHRSNLAAALVVLVTVAGVALLQVPRRAVLQVATPLVPATPAPIKVHVVGAVLSPGVYALGPDARVADALEAAGGPTQSADVASVNLATPLRDGQQLVIPERGVPTLVSTGPVPPSNTPLPARVDLNGASRQELEALPGIGPVTAQKILDYRQKNGRITSVEELRDARIVNSSTYEKIKELVEVR